MENISELTERRFANKTEERNNNNKGENSKSLIVVEIIEYIPKALVIRTILKKTTGNFNVVSYDTNEDWVEKVAPFDTFIQLVAGKADVFYNGTARTLRKGEAIIIPANSSHTIKSEERFKMIATTVKDGKKRFFWT